MCCFPVCRALSGTVVLSGPSNCLVRHVFLLLSRIHRGRNGKVSILRKGTSNYKGRHQNPAARPCGLYNRLLPRPDTSSLRGVTRGGWEDHLLPEPCSFLAPDFTPGQCTALPQCLLQYLKMAYPCISFSD